MLDIRGELHALWERGAEQRRALRQRTQQLQVFNTPAISIGGAVSQLELVGAYVESAYMDANEVQSLGGRFVEMSVESHRPLRSLRSSLKAKGRGKAN